ncbi:hypothetical protein EJ07DRAFT_176162 [Lizonia empirigonia]|nr:hypothetical protein EJ07DRAFT_176162 [Lizonia empirigonia]
MSTAVLGVRPLSTQHRHFEPDLNMDPKNASMYGTSDQWATASPDVHASMTATDYLGFSLANPQSSDGQFTLLQSNYEQMKPNDHNFHNNKAASKRSFAASNMQSSLNASHVGSSADMYPSSTVFMANNAHMRGYDLATISPTDTRFEVDHTSLSSDSKYPFDTQMQHAGLSNFATFTDDIEPLSSKHRCDSLQSNPATHSPRISPPKSERRRGSEYAEPGSARAIYLEKNRKAASKCRSKQKRQQEELVETARDVERRNKILKAEVEILKSGMQELMQLVGQHTECPDTRLKLYLQREADRLATGVKRNSLPPPLSHSPFSGISSINEMSSSEGE